jgi:hypothetical protein
MSPVWIKRNDFKAELLQFNSSSDAGRTFVPQLISHWVIGKQRGYPESQTQLLIAEIEHKVNDLVVSKPGILNILWAKLLLTTFWRQPLLLRIIAV